MSGRDYLHIWYQAQLCVATLFAFVIFLREAMLQRPIMWLMAFLLVISVIGVVTDFYPKRRRPEWLAFTNRWLQAIFQPLLLVVVWGVVTRQIIVLLYLPARGILTLTLLYYMVMFAPFASVIGTAIEWTVPRVVCLLYWSVAVIQTIPLVYPESLTGSRFLMQGLHAGLFGSVSFFILVTTLMRGWHLSWPGLKPHWHSDISVWVIIFLVAFDLVFTFWNAFNNPSKWWGLLTQYNFSGIRVDRLLTMQAAAAGIAEETLFRFGILGVLLAGLRHSDHRVPASILISATLFGLIHFTNVSAQQWDTTTIQVLGAFGTGLFFSCVYLYTGQLWMTMLMHFLVDWTAFMTLGVPLMVGHATSLDWAAVTFQLVIDVAIFIWMLFGDRRHAMERHANRFTGRRQRFDYVLPKYEFH